MKDYSRGKIGIIACDSGRHFAKKVAKELKEIIQKEEGHDGVRILDTKETKFSNSEMKTEIEESVRNEDLYIFQDVENKTEGLSINDNFMVLKTAIEAAKRADANFITVVIPSFPYARQDKPKTREAVTAAMAARELEDAGATRVIALDIHTEAITGFFRKANLENLRASKELMHYIKKKFICDKNGCDFVIVSPDAGGAARANFFAKMLGTTLAIIHKERDYSKSSSIENMKLLGDVKGKKAVVVDDMIDTAGTLVNAAKKLKEEGATEVYFAASLCMLNNPAIKRIQEGYDQGYITKVIGTDVIYHGEDFKHVWYEEVELANYFARVIYNINRGISISKLLD